MGAVQGALSSKARAVLDMIAKGYSYERILASDQELTYLDIFDAAREALELSQAIGGDYAERMDWIRRDHPRAYLPWGDEEDAQLRQLVRAGTKLAEIARIHQRQPGAIRSRMAKLGLNAAADASARLQHDGLNDDDSEPLPF